MTHIDLPLGDDQFVSGRIEYRDALPHETVNRILITVTVGDATLVEALVDTGAGFSKLSPDLAEQINLVFEGESEVTIGGGTYKGKYGRTLISFEASAGTGLTVEAMVWIPTLQHAESWPHPNIIGYQGLLDKIRFAVDPERNLFYFGGRST